MGEPPGRRSTFQARERAARKALSWTVLQIRFDRAHFRLTPLVRPFDLRVYQGRAARVQPAGDGLEYPWGTEYRDESELERIVAQLPGKSITLLHPGGLIAEGAPATIVGKVRAARVVDDHAVVDLETDSVGRDAIEGISVEGGPPDPEKVHELSLGYTCRVDDRGFQRDTVVDHLALVPAARCGPTCALRTDHANTDAAVRFDWSARRPVQEYVQGCSCNIDAGSYVVQDRGKEATMDELKKLLEAAQTALAAEKARADRAEADRDAEKRRADTEKVRADGADAAKVTAEVAATNAQAVSASEKARADAEKMRADRAEAAFGAEKARADAAEVKATEKARSDGAAAFDARVDARVKIFEAANRVLGAADDKGQSIDRTGLSDRDIKVQIIKHVDGIDVTTHQAAQGIHFDAYVDGVYSGALDRHARATQSHTDARTAIHQPRRDQLLGGGGAPQDTEQVALASMRHDTSTAWARRPRRARA
jgi:hypothetical protein